MSGDAEARDFAFRSQSPIATMREQVSRREGAVLTEKELGCAEQLARFFPSVARRRTQAVLVVPRAAGRPLKEVVELQYGGSEYAIFLSTLPIEFNDPVRLLAGEGGQAAEGIVIAVQYDEGHKAVAVRLANGGRNWLDRR